MLCPVAPLVFLGRSAAPARQARALSVEGGAVLGWLRVTCASPAGECSKLAALEVSCDDGLRTDVGSNGKPSPSPLWPPPLTPPTPPHQPSLSSPALHHQPRRLPGLGAEDAEPSRPPQPRRRLNGPPAWPFPPKYRAPREGCWRWRGLLCMSAVNLQARLYPCGTSTRLSSLPPGLRSTLLHRWSCPSIGAATFPRGPSYADPGSRRPQRGPLLPCRPPWPPPGRRSSLEAPPQEPPLQSSNGQAPPQRILRHVLPLRILFAPRLSAGQIPLRLPPHPHRHLRPNPPPPPRPPRPRHLGCRGCCCRPLRMSKDLLLHRDPVRSHPHAQCTRAHLFSLSATEEVWESHRLGGSLHWVLCPQLHMPLGSPRRRSGAPGRPPCRRPCLDAAGELACGRPVAPHGGRHS
mmetsp:Transcript_38016/g.83484  ORF Transcript_38016/g.83484 Transcript_38016/m.83484 type:complete len:406 (-) Transcript_38016:612-1829(-)